MRVVLHNLSLESNRILLPFPVPQRWAWCALRFGRAMRRLGISGASVATPALGEPELRRATDRLGVGNHFTADGIQVIHPGIAEIIGLWFAEQEAKKASPVAKALLRDRPKFVGSIQSSERTSNRRAHAGRNSSNDRGGAVARLRPYHRFNRHSENSRREFSRALGQNRTCLPGCVGGFGGKKSVRKAVLPSIGTMTSPAYRWTSPKGLGSRRRSVGIG